MAKFAYNNAKNASTGHTTLELNCSYHPRISFEKDTDLCYWLKITDELSAKLRELMIVCRKNLYYAQKLQKQAYDKSIKLRSYAPGNKVWLNSKYIKTKWNWKLEATFYRPFWVLYPVGKQDYKLKLLKK